MSIYKEMTTTTTSFLNSLSGAPSDTTKGKAAGVPLMLQGCFRFIKGGPWWIDEW